MRSEICRSLTRDVHGPEVPLNVASICSSVLPLVSGMKAVVKTTLRVHMQANNQKVPALVRRLWKRSQLFRHGCLSHVGGAIEEGLMASQWTPKHMTVIHILHCTTAAL